MEKGVDEWKLGLVVVSSSEDESKSEASVPPPQTPPESTTTTTTTPTSAPTESSAVAVPSPIKRQIIVSESDDDGGGSDYVPSGTSGGSDDEDEDYSPKQKPPKKPIKTKAAAKKKTAPKPATTHNPEPTIEDFAYLKEEESESDWDSGVDYEDDDDETYKCSVSEIAQLSDFSDFDDEDPPPPPKKTRSAAAAATITREEEEDAPAAQSPSSAPTDKIEAPAAESASSTLTDETALVPSEPLPSTSTAKPKRKFNPKSITPYALRKPPKHPSRKDFGRGEKIIDDALESDMRWYYKNSHPNKAFYPAFEKERKKGRDITIQEFSKEFYKNTGNYKHLIGKKNDDGLTASARRNKRMKEDTERMIAEGVPPEETPLFIYRAKKNAARRKKITCPYCDLTLTKNSIRIHVKSFHKFCSNLLAPLTPEERAAIEEKTREGAKSEEWRFERRGRITASRAAKIYRRKRANPNQIARKIMQPVMGKGFMSDAMKRGLELEPEAVQAYLKEKNVAQDQHQYPVGFMIHPKYGFIGATPDALIAKDGLVEIKCPIVPAKEIPKRRGGRFLVYDENGVDGMRLNRNHAYYDQVVQQIMCSEREYCDFVVYFPGEPLWIERITREEAEIAWIPMEKAITEFYFRHLGPKEGFASYLQ